MLVNLTLVHVTLGLVYVLIARSTNNPDMTHVAFVMLHILFHEAIKKSSMMRASITDIESRTERQTNAANLEW